MQRDRSAYRIGIPGFWLVDDCQMFLHRRADAIKEDWPGVLDNGDVRYGIPCPVMSRA